MHELEIRNSIVATLPTIEFKDYEMLKEQAEEVASYISQVEVTEDNVKEAKKLLATVNKSVSRLNKQRISIKQEIMSPYELFAAQVREIEKIVKDADEIVRNQVRELEEREREKKKELLEEIWNNRIQMYDNAKLVHFKDWLQSKHLNKSESLTKVESEMVEFLESVESNVSTILNMDSAEDILVEYTKSLDLGESIKKTQEKNKQLEENREVLKEVVEEQFAFIIKNKKDKTLLELLLKENNIAYELRRI